MVVARQILLIFNLSYLPRSVQFVNKNYCHAKKRSFYDLLMPLFCAWMMYCEFGRSFKWTRQAVGTECGSDVESQMSKVRKRLRSENRWELLQEKCTDMKLHFLERGIPVDLSIIKLLKFFVFDCSKNGVEKYVHFYLKFTPRKFLMHILNLVSLKDKFLLFKRCIVCSGTEFL